MVYRIVIVEINLFSIHKYNLWYVIKLVIIMRNQGLILLSAYPLLYIHPTTP